MRAQKQSQQVKASAAQYRAATERQAERMRERLAGMSMTSIKSLLPDIRISSAAFVTQECNMEQRKGLAEQQLVELEKRHVALMGSSQATKQLALDAMHAMHLAEHRLHTGVGAAEPAPEPAPLDQRALFPPLRPLATTDTAETHPALRALQTATEALEDRVDQVCRWAARHDGRRTVSSLASSGSTLAASQDKDAMRLSELRSSGKENLRAEEEPGAAKRRRTLAHP